MRFCHDADSSSSAGYLATLMLPTTLTVSGVSLAIFTIPESPAQFNSHMPRFSVRDFLLADNNSNENQD